MRGNARVPVALAALLWFALVAAFVLASGLVRPARADRLYPYLELSRACESGREPRDWASLGCPVSFGRFAPSVSAGVSPRWDESIAFDGRVIFAVRYKL